MTIEDSDVQPQVVQLLPERRYRASLPVSAFSDRLRFSALTKGIAFAKELR